MTFTDNKPSHLEKVYCETPEGFCYELPHDGGHNQEVVNHLLVEDPYRFHPPGSPYLGLSVKEQKLLSKIRRGGSRTPAYILKKMRKARPDDYQKILLKCVEGLIYFWQNDAKRLDRCVVYLKIPFNYKRIYSKDLPRVFPVAWHDYAVTVQFRIDHIVDWLYNKGHSPFDAKTLRKNTWAILKEQDKLDWYYTYAADISKVEMYGEIVLGSEQERVRKSMRDGTNKGRNVQARAKRRTMKKENIVEEKLDNVEEV